MTSIIQNALEVRDIQILVGSRILFSSMSFDVAVGDKIAILGPNGVGKTTLLKILAGISKPTSGKVNVCSQPLWPNRNNNIFGKICYLATTPALLLDETVTKNLEFFCSMYGKLMDNFLFTDALSTVGLEGRHFQIARTLSTGQKRRLTLAILLLLKPAVVLADEPNHGLDTEGSKLALRVFDKLVFEHQTSFVIASHDNELQQWCSKHLQLKPYVTQKLESSMSLGEFL